MKDQAWWLAAAPAVVGLSALGLGLVHPSTGLPLMWPLSAVALWLFWFAPKRRRPVLAAGLLGCTAVATLLRDQPAPLWLPALVTLEPWVAVVVMERLGVTRGRPLTVRALATALLGVLAVAAVAAVLAGLLDGGPFATAARVKLTAAGVAMALAVPLAIVPLRLRRPTAVDAAGVLATAVTAAAVFLHAFGDGPALVQFPYLVFLPLLGTAILCSPTATGLAATTTAAVAMAGTANGLGPFVAFGVADRVEAVQTFCLAAGLCAAFAAAIVRERGTASAAARKAAERFESVLRAATEDAVIATDQAGVFTLFNEGAERMLGRSADEVVGRLTPLAFLDADEVARRAEELGMRPGLATVLAAPGQDWTFVRADGTRLTGALALTPVRDADGRPAGFMGIGRDITATRDAQQRLAESERRHRELVAHLPDTLAVLFDLDLRITLVEGPMLATLGLTEARMAHKRLEDLVPREHTVQFTTALERARFGEATELTYHSARFRRVFRCDVVPMLHDGRVTEICAILRDISEREEQRAKIEAAERDLRRIVDAAPVGHLVIDPRIGVVDCNRALVEMLGLTREQLTRATSADEFLDAHDAARVRAEIAALLSGEEARVELQVTSRHPGGRRSTLALHGCLLDTAEGQILLQVVDVTERIEFEAELRRLADHDPLTGLPNRRRFEHELLRHVDRARHSEPHGAVMLLDVDDFKRVNDTLGHTAGDDLIVTVASALSARLAPADVLARLGGDEFAVLLPGAQRDEAARVAEELVAGVRAETAGRMGGRPVTVSLGITMLDDREEPDAGGLLVDADLAMYDAKDAGRDRVAFYRTADQRHPRTHDHMAWLARIERAIDTGAFELHAQPIVDLATGEVTQHEALVRMVEPGGERILPGAFLPIAERAGLITEIDRWVVRTAIGALEAGAAQTLEVNLSGHSLSDACLLADITTMLAGTNVAPERLVFEVTETAAIADVGAARAFAERLRALGCRFALDDFGAGYGSFYYMKHLPFDYLKIDGEFVRRCTTGETDRLVIDAVVRLAHGMGRRVIAEFVTDAATADLLRELGVDLAQGHHLGVPRPLLPVAA